MLSSIRQTFSGANRESWSYKITDWLRLTIQTSQACGSMKLSQLLLKSIIFHCKSFLRYQHNVGPWFKLVFYCSRSPLIMNSLQIKTPPWKYWWKWTLQNCVHNCQFSPSAVVKKVLQKLSLLYCFHREELLIYKLRNICYVSSFALVFINP